MICFLLVFLNLLNSVLAMGFVKGHLRSSFVQFYRILQSEFVRFSF